MNSMAAPHEDDRIGAGLEVFGADRAIDVQTLGPARVCILVLNGNASLADVTMMVINTQTLPHTADAAAVTVINILALRIIIEATVRTKIPCKLNTTGAAMTSNRLNLATSHTTDLLGSMAINLVVLLLVMTTTARVKTSAAVCLEPAVTRVVLTTGVCALARKAACASGLRGLTDEVATVFGVEGVDALGLLFGG
eukprot:GFKZ01011784.1.p2 GENE.GFKZ01011784.1~~GFKZ01011784.1.p2  ORF type:complete len:196 (-),score=13.58 GFKZ01011784.1:553-1140(-)